MTKRIKKSYVRGIMYAVIAFILAVLFIPEITVSEQAVLDQTLSFKVVDWFTVFRDSVASQAMLYILAIILVFGLAKLVKNYKLY